MVQIRQQLRLVLENRPGQLYSAGAALHTFFHRGLVCASDLVALYTVCCAHDRMRIRNARRAIHLPVAAALRNRSPS